MVGAFKFFGVFADLLDRESLQNEIVYREGEKEGGEDGEMEREEKWRRRRWEKWGERWRGRSRRGR